MDEGPVASAHDLAAATLAIDLAALKSNYAMFQKAAAPAACGAAVKANAYGLGMLPVASALWEAGCRTFFVALPGEGAELRAHLPEAEIIVLNGLLPKTGPEYLRYGLVPALASLAEAEEYAPVARALERRLPVALHVDTGLNRLGMPMDEAQTLARRQDLLGAFEVTLAMSHFACADEPGHEMNERQQALFEDVRALFPQARASLANSPGTLAANGYACDLVRPGIALYGGNPFANRPNPMRPVVRLYANILQVRTLKIGETVGYNATWTARRPSRIAIVGAGYADGLPRALSSQPVREDLDATAAEPALVYVGGQLAPVAGRVSMDLIAIDVTDISPDFVRRGARAELLGDHISVDDLARWAGTTPYEILTRLGSRFARLYSPG